MSNLTPEHLRRSVTIECGQSMTEQAHADEVNIHSIMDRYKATGMVDHINANQAMYEDMSDVPNYHEAMNIVVEAEQMFASIPAKIRDKFQNNPQVFLDYIQNPENRDGIAELGFPVDHIPEPKKEEPKKPRKAAKAPKTPPNEEEQLELPSDPPSD